MVYWGGASMELVRTFLLSVIFAPGSPKSGQPVLQLSGRNEESRIYPSMTKQKLELTWIGKDKRPKLEPRILLEEPDKFCHAEKSENQGHFPHS